MKRIFSGLLIAAAMLGSGCESVEKLNRYEFACSGKSTDASRDFQMTISSWPHLTNTTYAEIVHDGTNVLAAEAVLEGFPPRPAMPEVSFTMPGALVAGDYHVDLWADLNNNMRADVDPTDHTWRIPASPGGCMTFAHNTNFTDLTMPRAQPIGQDFELLVDHATTSIGKTFVAELIYEPTGATVGYYRLQSIPGDSFIATIPGIADEGSSYHVNMFLDLNNNFLEDASDTSWPPTASTTAPPGVQLEIHGNLAN